MKNKAAAKVFLLVSWLTLQSYTLSAETDIIAVPNWSLNDVNGETLEYYKDSEENVSVLLFWASWCPFCRSLMPHLQEVADEFREQKVKFYAMNVWEDGDPENYVRENGFTFRLLLMADLVAEDYGVAGTPGLMVVDQSHQLVYVRQSGQSDTEVKEAVKNAIRESLHN
jgi:thiol-disulfide isomerase/thioredoxin